MFAVPQSSILGPLLCNIFLADLFFMNGDIDIANFADENTPYTSAKYIDDAIETLDQASVSLFKWFELKLLKGNADKCHFLITIDQEESLNVDGFSIKNNKWEKLLEVKFISDLRKRASRKVNALARITPYMNLSKRRLLMKSFSKAQFNYYSLIWMCHSGGNNRNINQLHERSL